MGGHKRGKDVRWYRSELLLGRGDGELLGHVGHGHRFELCGVSGRLLFHVDALLQGLLRLVRARVSLEVKRLHLHDTHIRFVVHYIVYNICITA